MNDSTTVATSTSGATSARSSSIRMRNTTSSTTGMISRLSAVAAAGSVQGDRGAAADLGVGARHAVHRVAHPVDGVLGGLAVRRVGQRALRGTPARPGDAAG